ncbi:MAG TPA: deaminase [Rhizobacter sp.]
MSREDWDRYHIGAAMHASTKSKDPSTKVGCVLVGRANNVLSTGFNGFPRGVGETMLRSVEGKGTAVLDEARWTRPVKYKFVEHAERNAVYNAARHGVALDGATAYLNYAPCPCTDCARALIQVGVVAVVGPDIPFPGAGAGVHYDVGDIALVMLKEAGVELRTVKWGT